MVKLRWVSNKERLFPKLDRYPRGKTVRKGVEIDCTEKEAAGLLTMMDGSVKYCFEEVKKTRKVEPEIIKEDQEE